MKSEYVLAQQVTDLHEKEILEWCKGTVVDNYILIPTIAEEGIKAFVGDIILQNVIGEFNVFNNHNEFKNKFEPA